MVRREAVALAERAGIDIDDHDQFIDDLTRTILSFAALSPAPAGEVGWPRGTRFHIEHDGFHGEVIGNYVRLDGKRGVVAQQDGTNVVHVYGEKWLAALPASPTGGDNA
jgi:hypothetical protein